ncbi:tumor necrosis factor receptor superfamily member 10B-like [Branchiostoma floridae]|uniref:Tumor necrosis factor receptor superfamily member 10B-like n=1 Tax=Branchiostoma floridae TaxID=7739 RepID=A0A9J7HS75_BRAFL|nr:tumor necrosis factor receptor superfamily member 10B-like [Branchiostoma floridae]
MAEGEHSPHIVDVQEYFDDVIAEASHNWDNLARKLGFSENEIKVLRTDGPDQDRRCREMLHKWRNRKGMEATLQVLQQALVDIKERLTAEKLEGKTSTHKKKRKRKAKKANEVDSSEDSNVSSMENGLYAGFEVG